MRVHYLIYLVVSVYLCTVVTNNCPMSCGLSVWEQWSACQPIGFNNICVNRFHSRNRKKRNIFQSDQPLWQCSSCGEVEYEKCGTGCHRIREYAFLMIEVCDCPWGTYGDCCEHTVHCNKPADLQHASYSPKQDVYWYDTFITYSCDEGYKMTNPTDSRIYCTIGDKYSGAWTGNLPECLSEYCNKPADLEHGSYSPKQDVYQFESLITYSCDEGYNMTDLSESRVRCTSSRDWTGKQPKCLYAESCKSNPCHNNGACKNLLGNYTCSCTTVIENQQKESPINVQIVGGTLGAVCFALLLALVVVIVRTRYAALKCAETNKVTTYSSPAVPTVDQHGYSTLDIARDTPSQQTMGTYENGIIGPF